MSAGRPTLLVIQHVPWETPHHILDVCDGLLARALGAEVRAGERPRSGSPRWRSTIPPTRSSARWLRKRLSCIGTETSSICRTAPPHSPPRPGPSSKPSGTATPGGLLFHAEADVDLVAGSAKGFEAFIDLLTLD